MRPQRALTLLSIVAIASAACTTGAASPSTAPVVVATLAATSVPQATSSPASLPAASTGVGPGGSAAPTALDPCALLTQEEASTAVGATLGAGSPTLVDQNRVCTWKTGTTEVKLILAPPAPDATTAQNDWDAAAQDIPNGVTVNAIGQIGDRAAYGTGGASGFSVSAMFVIKGAQFFDFYCGLKACTEAASVIAANLIVGRLP
jgi:hypothetical protein